jgi:LAO/AO transport system kinase
MAEKPRGRNSLTTAEYLQGILTGNRGILGRAVTLLESNAEAHQQQAQELLKELLPHTGGSIRVGISGVPGAGKSTFIEALGCLLTAREHRVAVLTVDPSSSVTGGSILGDKTRMEKLSRDPGAFIRPSPSGGSLGGVTRKTRETILLFEAAGYDVILVETVGVGQNEITVRSMVDFFLLILIAGAGDELQGIKRGVMEIADAVVINKADGPGEQAARLARAEYERALHYLQPATRGWVTGAHCTSALSGSGIEEIWDVILKFRELTSADEILQDRRRSQTRDWLHEMVDQHLRARFRAHPSVANLLPSLETRVMSGELPVTRGVWQLLAAFEENGE